MFTLVTLIGIAVSIIILMGLLASIRWQLRFGDFWIYSILFCLFLIPVVLATCVESSMLSPASLARKFAEQPELTADQVLARETASRNSIILIVSVFFGILSLLLSALTGAKARRLKRLASAG